eukprot:s1469_g6.t2
MSCRKTEYPQSAVSSAISSDPGISGASGNKGMSDPHLKSVLDTKLGNLSMPIARRRTPSRTRTTYHTERLSSFSSFKSYVEHMLERRF